MNPHPQGALSESAVIFSLGMSIQGSKGPFSLPSHPSIHHPLFLPLNKCLLSPSFWTLKLAAGNRTDLASAFTELTASSACDEPNSGHGGLGTALSMVPQSPGLQIYQHPHFLPCFSRPLVLCPQGLWWSWPESPPHLHVAHTQKPPKPGSIKGWALPLAEQCPLHFGQRRGPCTWQLSLGKHISTPISPLLGLKDKSPTYLPGNHTSWVSRDGPSHSMPDFSLPATLACFNQSLTF